MEKDENNLENKEVVKKKNAKKTEEKTEKTTSKKIKETSKTTKKVVEEKKKSETQKDEKIEENLKKEEIKEEEKIKTNSNENVIEPQIAITEEAKPKIEKETQANLMEETKKSPKAQTKHPQKIISILIITACICFLIIFSVIFALININNDKILSGISIMGIDVSKLSTDEATEKLEEITQNKEIEDITLKYNDYETSINGKQFSIKYDIEKAVREAYNIGKDGNIITNNYNILLTQIFKKDIKMETYYDEEALSSKLKDISSKIPEAVKQSSYYVEDEKLIIVKGSSGIKIIENENKNKIIEEMKKLNEKNAIIKISVETVEPDKIDLEKIRNEIYKEAKDAYVSKNPTTVHPHENGVDFKISIEEAQKLLEEDKKEYEIPLKITVPSKTIRDLGEEAFPDELATYTTRYDPSNLNRSNNLTIAASKINGTILMPGEVFSYNKIVGARTIEAGYKAAGAYAGGKVVQEVGGGICQISSTIYNTALLANLEIVDRSNHQFLTSYVPDSRDATVSWGYLDFKFKNTKTYPIKIVASAKNGVAKVTMYGIKEKTEYQVFIQSKRLSYIPCTVKYIEDSSLPEGKEIVEQAGYNGCKSEAYRILKLNGQVISKTLLSRDTYDPMQRIIRRGTKKVTTTKPTTQSTKTSETEEN